VERRAWEISRPSAARTSDLWNWVSGACSKCCSIGLHYSSVQLFCSCTAEPAFDVASASPSQFDSWDDTEICSGRKDTDLDQLRPRRVVRRLKLEGYVELLPLHSSVSPRLQQAGPSFSMSNGLSLSAILREWRRAV